MKSKIEVLKMKSSDGSLYQVYPRTLIRCISNENGDNLETTLKEFIKTNLVGTYPTKEYVAEQISNSAHLVKEIVDVLPSVENAKENVIYMVKDSSVIGNDKYKEYQLIGTEIVMIGDTSIDLTNYVDINLLSSVLDEYASNETLNTKVTELQTSINSKANAGDLNNYVLKPSGVLNTSILEKAESLAQGIYCYILGGSEYEGNDLNPLTNAYKYSTAIVTVRFDTSRVVVLIAENENAIATNARNATEWTGWKINVNKDDLESAINTNISTLITNRGMSPEFCIDLRDTTIYSEDTWYPVVSSIGISSRYFTRLSCCTSLGHSGTPSWCTHSEGFSCYTELLERGFGWGVTDGEGILLNSSYKWCGENPIGYTQMTNSNLAVFWLRGGAQYYIQSSISASLEWTVYTEEYTFREQTVRPQTTCPRVHLQNKAAIKANIEGYLPTTGGNVTGPIYVDNNGCIRTEISPLGYAIELDNTKGIQGFARGIAYRDIAGSDPVTLAVIGMYGEILSDSTSLKYAFVGVHNSPWIKVTPEGETTTKKLNVESVKLNKGVDLQYDSKTESLNFVFS